MFKGKKIFITIIVLVLMVAMAVTAYATSYTCTLYASNTDSVHTASLLTRFCHRAGFNQPYSTNSMIVRLQMYRDNEWVKVLGDYRLTPGIVFYEEQNDWGNTFPFRTKLFSQNYLGGASGVGSINN
jgi:hypothetical protein